MSSPRRLPRLLSSRSITMRHPQCPIRQHGSTVESGCLPQGRPHLCHRPESRFLRPPVLRCPSRVAGSPHLRVVADAETHLLQVALLAVPADLLQRADGHRWVAVHDSRFQVRARSPVLVPADVPVVVPVDVPVVVPADVPVVVPAGAGRLAARVAGIAVARNSSRWTCRATRPMTQPSQTE